MGNECPKRLKDSLVAEEPFTLTWQGTDGIADRLGSTMRTPGDDLALAAGMLFAEGALQSLGELQILSFCSGGGVNELNRLKAELKIQGQLVNQRLNHKPSAALPQSSCGMCSVDNLSNPGVLLNWAAERGRGLACEPEVATLHKALDILQSDCPLFLKTGASHACIVVGEAGESLSIGEDVGRHNACDKALGKLFLETLNPENFFQLPAKSGLLFSSRLSFELASKAVAAGASWMASVGAPTHLAVELAQKCGLSLYGFLSKERFNQYSP